MRALITRDIRNLELFSWLKRSTWIGVRVPVSMKFFMNSRRLSPQENIKKNIGAGLPVVVHKSFFFQVYKKVQCLCQIIIFFFKLRYERSLRIHFFTFSKNKYQIKVSQT